MGMFKTLRWTWVIVLVLPLAGAAGEEQPANDNSRIGINPVPTTATATTTATARTGQSPVPTKATVMAAGAVYDGFTRPSLEITVGSRDEGLVEEVLVEEGQAVKKGQPILRLDSTLEKFAVELGRVQAEGDRQLEAAQLIEKQKQAELERAKVLLPKGGITGTEFEQKDLECKVAQLNIDIARAKQQASRIEFQKDQARLAAREIKAPTDGVIVRVHKKIGESVERLARAADLVQLDPLEIVLNLPVETRGSFKVQQAAAVQITGDAQWHPAAVTFVDPVVDFASNSYRVKVRLPNPGAKIQAGLRAKVDLSAK